MGSVSGLCSVSFTFAIPSRSADRSHGCPDDLPPLKPLTPTPGAIYPCHNRHRTLINHRDGHHREYFYCQSLIYDVSINPQSWTTLTHCKDIRIIYTNRGEQHFRHRTHQTQVGEYK